MSFETQRFYDFENFRLDMKERALLRDGKFISITPKVFETLQFLVENAGRLLEKEELMQKVWQGRIVEESNLTFNIKMLRKALGDSASEPRFIETVPRRGYRFIAEVKEIFPETEQISLPIEISRRPQKSYAAFAALSVFLLCTLVAGSWMSQKQFSRSSSNAPILSAPFHSEKLTNSGKANLAVISPDGKLAAYTDESKGNYSIWLKHLETSDSIQIIAPTGDQYLGLAFAHDGQTLFFARKPRGEDILSTVYRLPISGGIPEKILEHAEGWISLSPDDRQISFVRCERKDNDYCSLMIADADGKNERKLLPKARPIRIGDNQFSPDGTRIAFAFGQSANGGSDFHLAQFDLENSKETVLSPKTFFDIKSLKWLPEGNELLLAAIENIAGKLKIWQVSTATGEAEPLTKDAANYKRISLNNDASRMVALQVSDNFRLYLAADGETRDLIAAREATFSPTGKIVYTNNGDIWTINRDGGGQRQLTNSVFIDFSPRVAPDGCCIYFASNRSGVNQVWRMNADGSDQTQLTKNEGGYPRFVSLNGQWIYYESGLHQTLWKIAAEGGDEIRVSEQKLYAPAFSPDGNFVAYFFSEREKDSRTKIAVMSVENQKILSVFTLADPKLSRVKIAWSNDNKTINYVTVDGSKNSLWQQSLDEDQPRFAADLGDKQIEDFALAPNDNAFTFVRGEWLYDAVLIDGLK